MKEELNGTAEPDDEVESGRRRDPELLAMERVVRILDTIDAEARGRAMLWLNARYGTRRDPAIDEAMTRR